MCAARVDFCSFMLNVSHSWEFMIHLFWLLCYFFFFLQRVHSSNFIEQVVNKFDSLVMERKPSMTCYGEKDIHDRQYFYVCGKINR